MQARAKIELEHAFIVCPEHIRRIWTTLSDLIGPPKVIASCADHIERTFANCDDLLAYENARSRSIRALTFRAHSKEYPGTSASLYMRGESYVSSLSFDVEGDEPSILTARDKMGELFDGMRAWYSAISRIDFIVIMVALLVFAWAIIQVMYGSDSPKKPLSLSLGKATLVASAVVAFFGMYAALFWGLNRLRKRFFPVATYAIGQGKERYDFDDKVRWVVLVGFAVSVISSIIVALLLPSI